MRNSPKDFYKKFLGAKGELKAQEFLKEKGYKILDKNYKTKFGEVDIIAVKGGVLTFVEVKTRTSDKYGTPAMAVGYQKQKKYRELASYYINATGYDGEISFAVCEVYEDIVNLIENAF